MTEFKPEDLQNRAVFDRTGQFIGRIGAVDVDPQTKAVRGAQVKLDERVKAKYPNLSTDTFPLDLSGATITRSKSIRLDRSLEELKAKLS